jgi:hypothetical protein
MNSSLALETLSNVASTYSVNLVNDDTSIYAFLAPANLSSMTSSNDYFASTLVLTTQCTPVSQVCNSHGAFGSSTPFSCPSGFSGDVTAHFWNKQFFDNSSSNNPFTFAFAALYPDGSSVREGTPRLVHLYLASLDSFLNSTDLHNASRWTLTSSNGLFK